ncbi:MAG: serine--tRNA ligase [Geminicoccaceae bacterium]|nr:MAG: serine--tRNA ligase [Geminicoccaceae bacterium]
MHDIKLIRDDRAAFDRALARRGLPPAAGRLLELDAARRALLTELQEWEAERNATSKAIGTLKREGGDVDGAMARVAELKARIQDGRERERDLGESLDAALAELPNRVAADVPDGANETANAEVRRWGLPRDFDFEPRDHLAIGEGLGLDLERAARMSGARFAVGMGQAARLHRALGQFMLDVQTREHGYTEVYVPYLVRDNAVFGTGQLPKFAADLFQTTSGYWLIPTAEVPLTNLVAEEILEAERLPLRFTALSPCFRSEAGSAGRDTRGMIRMHQFEKVELVSITGPEDSETEHERMTACAEAILEKLALPYRVVSLAAGDLGFGAMKTYDLEVWLPAQATYREISSCSNCGDFQARRMNARFRPKGERQTRFVHTLNGSGLAVGRAFVAVLENYQEADGSVTVPAALRPYLGGQERLTPS